MSCWLPALQQLGNWHACPGLGQGHAAQIHTPRVGSEGGVDRGVEQGGCSTGAQRGSLAPTFIWRLRCSLSGGTYGAGEPQCHGGLQWHLLNVTNMLFASRWTGRGRVGSVGTLDHLLPTTWAGFLP